MILVNIKKQRSHKLKLAMAVMLLLCTTALMAQTPMGLGSKMASPNAVVHMGTQGGLIIPKVSLTSATVFLAGKTATADDVSMLVYNTNTATANGLLGTGFYYWTGSTWTWISTTTTVADDLGNHIATQDIKLGTFGITDTDGNTKIRLEKGTALNTNDDIIRFDTAGTERMLIDSSGKVGIGSATPLFQFEVWSSQMLSSSGGMSVFHTNGTQGLTFGYSGIAKGGTNTDSHLTLDAKGAGNVLLNSSATGNVGIGSTNAPHKLTVNGDAQVTGIIYDSDGSKGNSGDALATTEVGTNWVPSLPPTGSILMYAGATAPAGWLLCNGAAIPVNATTAALRTLIGTNTPNLAGRFLRGAGGKGPALRTTQDQAVQGHSHYFNFWTTTDRQDHQHTFDVQADATIFQQQGGTEPDQLRSHGELHPNEIPGSINDSWVYHTDSGGGGHQHTYNVNGDTANTGGADTRPDNYGINYIIKL